MTEVFFVALSDEQVGTLRANGVDAPDFVYGDRTGLLLAHSDLDHVLAVLRRRIVADDLGSQPNFRILELASTECQDGYVTSLEQISTGLALNPLPDRLSRGKAATKLFYRRAEVLKPHLTLRIPALDATVESRIICACAPLVLSTRRLIHLRGDVTHPTSEAQSSGASLQLVLWGTPPGTKAEFIFGPDTILGYQSSKRLHWLRPSGLGVPIYFEGSPIQMGEIIGATTYILFPILKQEEPGELLAAIVKKVVDHFAGGTYQNDTVTFYSSPSGIEVMRTNFEGVLRDELALEVQARVQQVNELEGAMRLAQATYLAASQAYIAAQRELSVDRLFEQALIAQAESQLASLLSTGKIERINRLRRGLIVHTCQIIVPHPITDEERVLGRFELRLEFDPSEPFVRCRNRDHVRFSKRGQLIHAPALDGLGFRSTQGIAHLMRLKGQHQWAECILHIMRLLAEVDPMNEEAIATLELFPLKAVRHA